MFGLNPEPNAQHTSEDCLSFLIQEIANNPMAIRAHVSTITDAESDQLNKILWPALSVPDNWFRERTHRPSVKELEVSEDEDNPNPLSNLSRDSVIRTYVNDIWDEHGRYLEARVISSYGDLSVEFVVNW